MKLVIILMTIFLTKVSATGFAQRITLKENGTPLSVVLQNIRTQVGYDFVFDTKFLLNEKKVYINIEDAKLEDVLVDIFRGRKLTYTIKNKSIVIRPKIESFYERIVNEFFFIDVRGKVIDARNGQPLMGANINLKGSSRSVHTDKNGEFFFKNVDSGSSFNVSYIGFESQEVAIPQNRSLLVRMIASTSKLEEVQVIQTGYQTLKKTQLTGAYTSINRETYLQAIPTTGNIAENMEGRLAGLVLNINDSRGEFTNQGQFTIRGISTFQAIKKPLIVMDGYPTEIDVSSLNPYDIESITVLKDAAAAAIYGVRATNGVIVIVTKKGKIGKPIISFTSSLTIKPKTNYEKLKLLSGKGYIDYAHAVNLYNIEQDGISTDFYDSNNQAYLPLFKISDDLDKGRITQIEADKRMTELSTYDNMEDYKRLFLQNSFLQSYDLNISGGTENSSHYFGINHQDNKGSERFSSHKRMNLKYNGTFQFFKRFNLEVQSVYSNLKDNSSNIPDYLSFEPYQKFVDDQGKALPTFLQPYNYNFYGFGPDGSINTDRNQKNMDMGLYDVNYYPYQDMFESNNTTSSNIFHAQAKLTTRIFNGLNFEIGGVFERQIGEITNFASENSWETRLLLNYYAIKDPVSGQPVFQFPKGGVKKNTNQIINTHTLRAQLNYNKSFNENVHSFSFLLGAEQRELSSSSRLSTAFGYNEQTLTTQPVNLNFIGNRLQYSPGFIDELVPLDGSLRDQTYFYNYFGETYNSDRFVSVYANGDYTFDNRISVTGSLRVDQSNLFGKDPKFRYTPLWSTGVSWMLSEEQFLKDSEWINMLKVRFAGGYNGNIRNTGSNYSILSTSVNNYTPNSVIGYSVSSPPNSSLRWEKTLNLNGGIDFEILNRRVSGSIDYYIKNGKDLFASITRDPTGGFNSLVTNNASVQNRGLDISLVSRNIEVDQFKWQTQLTASFNKNEVKKLSIQFNSTNNFLRVLTPQNAVGYPMYSLFTMDYIGLNDQGHPMVKGENGEPIVINVFPVVDVPLDALHFSGVNMPKYTIGFNNHFTFGQFGLSALLMYYGGHSSIVAPPTVGGEGRPIEGTQNYWKKPGDEKNTDVPGFLPFNLRTEGYRYGTKFVRKLDFIALRTATLSYQLNSNIANKIGLRDAKVMLQISNPFKYVFSGNDIDPETLNFYNGNRGVSVLPSYSISFSTNF
ncbi:SusC/RagA family TonB-linked outer membrane protein [Pedobacter hiemivivus]|nr:SusC/RagA family TonB-linked outer membrane protein [Pedobacter hiemivivus]